MRNLQKKYIRKEAADQNYSLFANCYIHYKEDNIRKERKKGKSINRHRTEEKKVLGMGKSVAKMKFSSTYFISCYDIDWVLSILYLFSSTFLF